MTKNKESQQIGVPTMNDKMVINDNMGYKNGCLKHKGFKLNMIYFSFRTIRCTEIVRVESIGYNVEEHQEMHKGQYKH